MFDTNSTETRPEPPKRKRKEPSPNAMLLGATAVAEICGVSVRTIQRWVRAGLMPKPVAPGASKWRRADVVEWIELGCPRRTSRPRN